MAEIILRVELMRAVLDIINETYVDLPRDDRTRLSLVQIRPRSGEFSKVALSCSVAPNDPSNPENWYDEEIASPGKQYNLYQGARYLEMGLNQYYNLRFTVDFNFFFMRQGISKEESLESAEIVFARIHQALLLAGEDQAGRFSSLYHSDSFGMKLARGGAARCLKRKELRPGGSVKKPLYKGRMWLQFESLLEGD